MGLRPGNLACAGARRGHQETLPPTRCTVHTHHCTLRRKSSKLFSKKEPKLCKYWPSLGVSWNTVWGDIDVLCICACVGPQTREYSILEMATFLCTFIDDGIFSSWKGSQFGYSTISPPLSCKYYPEQSTFWTTPLLGGLVTCKPSVHLDLRL